MMDFSRREFLQLAGLGVAGTILAACAPKVEEEVKEVVEQTKEGEPQVVEKVVTAEPGPAQAATLTLWYPAGETAPCAAEVSVASFNAQSDSRQVEFVEKADLHRIINSPLAAGAGPDIFSTSGPAFSKELADAGLLLNLDFCIDEYEWDGLFPAWALDVCRVNGSLYSLPSELETIVLWYNATVFESHGWEPPETMDELVALCEQIETAGIIPFAGQGGECQPCNEWYFIEFMNKVAGPDKFYRALKGEIRWTDDDFEKGIALLADMLQKGWWMGDLNTFLAANFADAHSSFAKGESAMNMEGTWFYAEVDQYFTEDNPNEWAIAPFPSSSGDAIYSIGLGSAWAGNAKTEYPDIVGEFLNYYFSPAIQGALFANCSLASAPVPLREEDMERVDSRMVKTIQSMNEAFRAGDYGYTTWTFFPPKSLAYIYEEVERVWVGEWTAAQYLEGLDMLFQEELAEGAVPPVPQR